MFKRLKYNEACEHLSLRKRMRQNYFIGYILSALECWLDNQHMCVRLHHILYL